MTADEFTRLFFPYAAERRKFLQGGGRLAHYTSAEAGFKIISNQEVWLRNSMLMNDFSEIEHGLQCIAQAYETDSWKALCQLLNASFPGLTGSILEKFSNHVHGIKVATFIMSLSEHADDEDAYGRLSMWRAYGGKNGVALVLNPEIFNSEALALKVFSAPVMYASQDEFVAHFDVWAKNLLQNAAAIQTLTAEHIEYVLVTAFRLYALCTKHPAFSEEREWRVFYSPLHEQGSEWIKKEDEIISGNPQEVVKVALRDDAEKGVSGLSANRLLNRVIMGPSQSPLPTYHALWNALSRAGVTDIEKKLSMSLIPLRH